MAILAMMAWISPSAVAIASSATGPGRQTTMTAGFQTICSADVSHHSLGISNLAITSAASQTMAFVVIAAIAAAGPGQRTTFLETSPRMPCADAQMAETESGH